MGLGRGVEHTLDEFVELLFTKHSSTIAHKEDVWIMKKI